MCVAFCAGKYSELIELKKCPYDLTIAVSITLLCELSERNEFAAVKSIFFHRAKQ